MVRKRLLNSAGRAGTIGAVSGVGATAAWAVGGATLVTRLETVNITPTRAFRSRDEESDEIGIAYSRYRHPVRLANSENKRTGVVKFRHERAGDPFS